MNIKRKSLGLVLTILFAFSCAHAPKENSTEAKKAEIFYTHGTEKLMSEDYTEALALLLQANELNPVDSKILNNLGMAYFFKKRNDLALINLKKAIEVDPKNSDARNNLASIYLTLGDIDKAQEQYELVLSDLIYQHQFRTYFNLGLIAKRKNDTALAIKHFKKASELKQDYCAANYQLGNIYRGEHKYQEALEWYKSSIQGTCTTNVEPHFAMALTYRDLRQYDLSTKKFIEIKENFPKSPYAITADLELKKVKREEMFTIKQNDEIRRKYNLEKEKSGDELNGETFESPNF